MVRENNAAFHVIGLNQHTIGIEHADVCNDPAPYTTTLYERSSELVRDISRRHGFPINDSTVVGHVSVGHHDDPGPYWDWDYYFFLLAWNHQAQADRPIRQVVMAADQPAIPPDWRVVHRRAIAQDHCADHNDPYGSTYWEAAPAPGGSAAEFVLTIDQPGLYKASLWWPNVAAANPSVPVDVSVSCRHTGTCPDAVSQTVAVNQQRNAGRWNDLGTPFAVRLSAVDVRVRIRRDSPVSGSIRADAARILKVGSV